MGNSSFNNNSTLGGKALPISLYAIFYSLHALALSVPLNVWFIRIFYGLFWAMTIWFFVKVLLFENKSDFLRTLNFFILLVVVYGVIAIFTETSFWASQSHLQPFTFIQVHIESLLPIYVFYYFGKNGILKTSWFSIMFIVFCFDAFFMYKFNTRVVLNALQSADEGFINNVGYAFAALLPVVVFYDNKKVFQYIGIGIIVYFVLICVKRGALLISLVGILFFVYQSTRKSKKRNRIITMLLGLGLSLAIYLLFSRIIESNEFFMMRYTDTLEGNSSGRDSIYSFFWSFFTSRENVPHLFLGNGAFATYRLHGIEAHNDWLEYAIDMGLLGIIAYAVLWVRIGKNYLYYSKNGNNQKILVAMGMVVLMNFVRSFISMSIDNLYFFSAAILGYTMAVTDSLRKGIQL